MSVNSFHGIGNVGRDPEVRSTTGGQTVANFSIAINEQWKDAQGNKQERVTWVECIAWGKLGELVAQYVHKGRQVYVEGRLQIREYEAKDGSKRRATEIVCRDVRFLGATAGKGGTDVAASTDRSDDFGF